ncbi:zf-HC2 domain-containing protein [Lysobacter tyrosinilyticus]
MSGRVLEFEMRAHNEVQRLLPWLANDALEADERERVQRHLDACAECRRDLQEMLALQALIADRAEQGTDGDADAGWQRMRQRIGPTRPGRDSWWQALSRSWTRAPTWMAWAVALQAGLTVALAAALWWPRSEPVAYRALGHVMARNGNLLIVFDPAISEAQLRRLLDVSDARIVDGPNEAGAYVLAVPEGRVESVRDALRAAPGVTMVERLAAGESR